MNVTVKTNRIGIIKFLLPFYAVLSFFFVMFWISYIFNYEEMKAETFALVVFNSLEGLFTVGFICVKFINRKTFVFSADKITVCRGKKQISYDTNTIIRLKYNRFRFSMIIRMANGEMFEDGAWKLYVYFTDGRKVFLDMFSLKDAEKIKRLYGDMFRINDPAKL